jgi:hypothetical protein
MKTDNQHLEYLISQYVDGCLDGASKKSLEQKFITDPAARQLYKEQRDVQDVLDDWGSRIPLINWEDFDRKLSVRLEKETVGGGNISIFRRWARPMSAAAALLVAASLGYGWRAWSVAPTHSDGPLADHRTPVVQPSKPFSIDENNNGMSANRTSFRVDESAANIEGSNGHVAIISPDDVDAAKGLRAAVAYGMEGLTPSVTVAASAASNSTRGPSAAMSSSTAEKKDGEKETPPLP